jgi:hypothetical protein
MISFQQGMSLQDIEDAYLALDGRNSTIRLPVSLRFGGGVGVPASLTQFLAHWSRFVDNPLLRLYGKADSNAVESLAQEPHGIASVYFAGAIEDADGTSVSTRGALAYAVPRIKAMQASKYLDTMHGRGVFLCCFAGAKNEYLLPLYSRAQSGALRSRDEFMTLTERIINACAPGMERDLTPATLSSLGSLVYELFKNTDEHASTDESGQPYQRNVRTVMAKFVSYDVASAKERLGEEDPSLSFFVLHNMANRKRLRDEAGKPQHRRLTSFLELTVMDTGPGLVRRWLSKYGDASIDALSIEQEVEHVRQCFELHATTKDTTGGGGGLSHVVKTLYQLNAYMRLRTGRVCLVQDFSGTKGAEFAPRHWLKDQHELPLTVGASYSIIVPLSKNLL